MSFRAKRGISLFSEGSELQLRHKALQTQGFCLSVSFRALVMPHSGIGARNLLFRTHLIIQSDATLHSEQYDTTWDLLRYLSRLRRLWHDNVKSILNKRHKGVLAFALLIAGAALAAKQGFHVFIGVLAIGVPLALLIGSNSRIVHTLLLAGGLGSAIVPVAIDWAKARQGKKAYQESLDAFRRRLVSLRTRYPLPDGRTFGFLHKWQLHAKSDGSAISIGPQEIDLSAGLIEWEVIPPSPSALLPNAPWPCYITWEARQKIRKTLEEALLHDDIEKLLKPGLMQKRTTDERKGVPPTSLSADFFHKREKAYAVAKKTLEEIDEADRFRLPEWFEDAVRAGVDPRDIPDPDKPGLPPEPFRFWADLADNSVLVVPGVIFGGIGLGCLLYFRRTTLGH